MAKISIGVDIGSTGIRAAEVKSNGKTLKVRRVAEVPLERGIIVSGEVRDPEALADAVKLLWKAGKFTSKNVIVGIGGPQTLVRQVDLPWETEEVFRESLALRLGADLPVDPTEMTIDFHPLDDFLKGKVRMQRALIVASVNSTVENTADALLKAKLKLKRADFSPFALIRAAVAAAGDGSPIPGPPAEDDEWECEVVVDVGGQTTMVAIHYHGRPLFIRVVAAGSEAVTRALADNLTLTLEEAEQVRRALGIGAVSTSGDGALAVEDLTPAQIATAQYIMNAMAGSLVQVVRESVEYFLAASPHVTAVSRVLLSGGGVLLPGYADRLSSELRAPAELLAPIAACGTKHAKSHANLDPRMSIAIGLACEVN